MKNKLLLASFVGLMVCFSCKKQTTEPLTEPEQKVFENLQGCCTNGPCKTPIQLKNITGKLRISGYDIKGNPLIAGIIPDSIFSISDKDLPLFKYYGSIFSVCNMPEKIANLGKERKVKFDCRFIYLDIPTNTGGQIPQSDGYPTELIKIEILN
jgi:hypothetical protein